MTNNELLLKISDMLEEKLEQKLEEKLDKKLEEKLDKKLEEKLDKKLEEKLDKKLEEKLDKKLEEKFASFNILMEEKFAFNNIMLEAHFDAKFAGMESRLLHIEDDLRDVKLKLEHVVLPQIQLLAENYVPAANRFENASDDIVSMKADIELLKIVTGEHSKKLSNMS